MVRFAKTVRVANKSYEYWNEGTLQPMKLTFTKESVYAYQMSRRYDGKWKLTRYINREFVIPLKFRGRQV